MVIITYCLHYYKLASSKLGPTNNSETMKMYRVRVIIRVRVKVTDTGTVKARTIKTSGLSEIW